MPSSDSQCSGVHIAAPQAMEEVLLSYGGVLLVVSHDRRCMQTLTDRLFVLEGDGVVRLFDGPYYDVRALA